MGSNSSNGRDRLSGNGHIGPGPHEDFLELAALSTAGDLSLEERQLLRQHLAVCSDCQRALKEFEAVADVGVPTLASELDQFPAEHGKSALGENAPIESLDEVDLSVTAAGMQAPSREDNLHPVSHRIAYRRPELNWNFVWLPLAAAILLTIALGIYAYRFGKDRGVEIAMATLPSPAAKPTAQLEALEKQLSDAGHEHEMFKLQLAQRDNTISELRVQVQAQTSALNQVKVAQADLENSLKSAESQKQQQIVEQQKALQQKLNIAESSLRTLQAELDSVRQERTQEEARAASFEGQINDLNAQLRDREQAINKDEELLAHDRDIRDLMGARDLYIAEVYDVGRDGATRKPYGRVFYTRGKSLVFYAYDLDQQAGSKGATFQAWGRRGSETEGALNLGVFYKDDVGKRRWALKFDDPKLLEHIDAVFVTLEPNGEHRKPTGKPLLFAYLKVNPNHP